MSRLEKQSYIDELIQGITKRVLARERRRVVRLVKKIKIGCRYTSADVKAAKYLNMGHGYACDDLLAALKAQP